MEFITGQRFINSADLQLGLGRVIGENNRMVKVAFDAVGEERVYAKDSAPLTRYVPQVGDEIPHKDGWSLTVTEIKSLKGLNIYFGEKEGGEEDVIPETELANNISLDQPFERLMNGQIDKNRWFDLRQSARKHQQRLQQSSLHGLIGCRTTLLPHQLYIAHSVAHRHAPRVLLADEVGLGKTIEACLIVHQQLLTGRAQRAVIVVPESLTHQWMVEMLRRFNLPVTVMDEEKCVEIESSSGLGNPFESAQVVLLPMEMVLANPVREQQLASADFDLLVVDEAHHLIWPEQLDDETESESQAAGVQAYQLIEHLAGVIPGVLLLTATPEQLGRMSHFARLRLLDPNRFASYQAFLDEEAGFEPVADAVERLLDGVEPGAETKQLAETLSQWLDVKAEDIADEAGQLAVVNQLLDQHGTGRVLYRNTRQSVRGFPVRELHAYPLSCPEIYTDCQDQLTPEVEVDAWLEADPRVDWLVNQTQSLKPNKLLVIAHHATTVLQLADFLREKHGIHAAVFHEGMSLIERDQAAAWFADFEQGTQLLLCSEIGSEGRNFQFAQHLLFFDLPGHPDLLEQRIGRLDRIGQSDTIHLHVPYLQDTAQADWFKWYDQGLNLFTKTNPAAQQIHVELADQLAQGDVEQVIQASQQRSEALLQAMQKGRDRLLEYNSCRPEAAESLYDAACEAEQAGVLADFMHQAFDAFGVHHEEHSMGSEIIRPTDEMHGYFPHLMEEGMTVTYRRDIALANENMHYLTWEHPMVTELLDMILSEEKGNTCFAALKGSGMKPGLLFFECRYVVAASGHADMKLSRYLPSQTVRLLFSETGVEVGDKLTSKLVNKFKVRVPKHTAIEVMKLKIDLVKKLMQKAELEIKQRLPELLSSSAASATKQLQSEIDRLQQLAEHNGQVRPEELAHAEAGLEQVKQAIQQTQPQLDSIQVLVTM